MNFQVSITYLDKEGTEIIVVDNKTGMELHELLQNKKYEELSEKLNNLIDIKEESHSIDFNNVESFTMQLIS